jgi:hypothetical protein
LQSLAILTYAYPIDTVAETGEALQRLIISRSDRTNYEDVGKLKALVIVDSKERFGVVGKVCNDLQIQFQSHKHWPESYF